MSLDDDHHQAVRTQVAWPSVAGVQVVAGSPVVIVVRAAAVVRDVVGIEIENETCWNGGHTVVADREEVERQKGYPHLAIFVVHATSPSDP